MAENGLGIQYTNRDQQREAGTLGMWTFLATEVLFFGALMVAYVNYRLWLGPEFVAAARQTKVVLGTANTAILLTSSACMAVAVLMQEAERPRAAAKWLTATALLGLAFFAVKAAEYVLEYREQLVPVLNFDPAHGRTVELFFLFYFVATALHAVHILIGISLVGWLAVRCRRAEPQDERPVRLIGLYWHFVDIVWIFLFPLIYLAGRAG